MTNLIASANSSVLKVSSHSVPYSSSNTMKIITGQFTIIILLSSIWLNTVTFPWNGHSSVSSYTSDVRLIKQDKYYDNKENFFNFTLALSVLVFYGHSTAFANLPIIKTLYCNISTFELEIYFYNFHLFLNHPKY